MAYTNFERTIKITILSGTFYSWSPLKRIRPMVGHLPKAISYSSQNVNIRALVKVFILTTGIFPA